jgi:hypothetical protein
LHPEREKGVIFYQTIVRGDIDKHSELETKKRIYPANGKMVSGGGEEGVCNDLAFCAALEGGKLAW